MVFKDFSNLFEHYKLAGASTEIGSLVNKDKRLFRYEDYIMPHMISICDQTLNVTTLCHPEAVKLHAHDRKTGNNYFYCLYVYLLNEKSLLVTARQLNIHRSTLIYRLSKIAEIISVDLNDQKLRMHLILSYEILHFLDCLRG
jgi:DNA-binding PucR family transcriptional regulator